MRYVNYLLMETPLQAVTVVLEKTTGFYFEWPNGTAQRPTLAGGSSVRMIASGLVLFDVVLLVMVAVAYG